LCAASPVSPLFFSNFPGFSSESGQPNINPPPASPCRCFSHTKKTRPLLRLPPDARTSRPRPDRRRRQLARAVHGGCGRSPPSPRLLMPPSSPPLSISLSLSPSVAACLSGPSVATSPRGALPRRRRRCFGARRRPRRRPYPSTPRLQQAPPAAAAAGSSRCGLLLPVRVSSTAHKTLDACPRLFPTVKDGGDGHKSSDTVEQSSRSATTQRLEPGTY